MAAKSPEPDPSRPQAPALGCAPADERLEPVSSGREVPKEYDGCLRSNTEFRPPNGGGWRSCSWETASLRWGPWRNASGLIYLGLPDKCRTFERERARSIHVHVWTWEAVIEFVRYMIVERATVFTLEELCLPLPSTNEVIFLLRKTALVRPEQSALFRIKWTLPLVRT